ncbi:MAG: IS91 family transposase [Acetobacteraceae bacterium]|nr:IS91 family transposase [Acetobacteraceae bacterium]
MADVFRRHGGAHRQRHADDLGRSQLRVMRAIELCRTAALGGHTEQCDACSHIRVSYNSCRNRHCGKCQALARAAWLEARQADLLPVPYFHVVFTIPELIGAIALQNKRVVYDILFRSAAATLRTIAADPRHLGAEIGFIAVLHTWGQTLQFHPHLHCIVPAGGLAPEGQRWVACRPGFFLPVRRLSSLFRRLFLAGLGQAFQAGGLTLRGALTNLNEAARFGGLLRAARGVDWVVYAKPPFGGARHVLEYLGRYTHRVAIANARLTRIGDDTVSFRWKDYRHHNRQKVMTLDADEFIRRFLLHVLPDGFQRIRHYGLLGNRARAGTLARCRQLLGAPPPPPPRLTALADPRDRYEALTGRSLRVCPICLVGVMQRVGIIPATVGCARPVFWADTS